MDAMLASHERAELAIDESLIDGPLRFERRRNDRWPIHGTATAFRICGEEFGTIHELKLTDVSCEGLGALCDTIIEPGACVTLGFSNPGYLARRGTVVRCMPCGCGYRVGVRFEHRLAA
jgi:hypothetical protein